jgi:pimeloyl-ACP methyl ester carboxylesterase
MTTLRPQSQAVVTGCDLRVNVLRWGARSRPPLVALHGLRGYAATWELLARHLSPTHHVVAPDARGRGDSDWAPDGDYSTGAYLADLEAVVDELRLERFVLLGHSMGGTTAIAYAARHPGRVSSLIVEDMTPGASAAGPGTDRIRQELASTPTRFTSRADAFAFWRGRRPGVPDEAIESRLDNTLRPAPDGGLVWKLDAAGIARARLRTDPGQLLDLWPLVETLAMPALFIRGDRSDFSTPEVLGEMASRNRNISWTEIRGAGHYVHDDQPDAFHREVRRFMTTGGGR